MYRIIIPDEDEYFIDLRHDKVRPIYKISNYGNVINKTTGKILGKDLNNSGYYRVTLMLNNGKSKKFFVHRLVAEHFLENEDPLKTQVNHITEGDKTFNFYKNLEYVTPSENQLHHYKYGDSSKQHKGNKTNHYRGQDRYNANNDDDFIHRICKLLEDGHSVTDIRDSLKFDTDLNEKQLYAVIYHLYKRTAWPHITVFYNY